MNAILSASPHAHAPVSISRTMALVMLALTPATLSGLYQFGWPAIFLFTVTLASTAAFEALWLLASGRRVSATLGDGSALLTGWLVAMTLPPWAPWWIGVVGGAIAILLGKQVFGGIGQNLFNPAMVARVALLISFPLEMTRWVLPQPLFSSDAPGFLEGLAISFGGQQYDAYTGASILGHLRTELGQGETLNAALTGVFDPMSALLGAVPGSMGEGSALLLALGGLWLIAKRVIGWEVPATVLGTVAARATVMHQIDPDRYAAAHFHLLAGATMLAAFFIATDPVTSPVSRQGQLLFGIGVGLLIYVIRAWGGYPEGVGFAILLMNAATPMIDHYLKPRIYGRDRRGQPIEYPEPESASVTEAKR
jgi:electron transport complex protein RnfD